LLALYFRPIGFNGNSFLQMNHLPSFASIAENSSVAAEAEGILKRINSFKFGALLA
jgi:hypothetical protein